LDRFAEEVARVMAALDDFIKNEAAKRSEATAGGESPEDQPLTALATARLKKLFQELSEFIDKRDSDAIKLVSDIKTLLGPSNISDNFLKMESYINSFKFEQAKEALWQAARELGL